MNSHEDQLRQWIIDNSPEIRHDVNLMADLIRELVRLERKKAGFDNPDGCFELHPNSQKKHDRDPAFIGRGNLAGSPYRAAAWISKANTLKIAVSPQRRK